MAMVTNATSLTQIIWMVFISIIHIIPIISMKCVGLRIHYHCHKTWSVAAWPSLPSPAGSQARSIFSGGLFQVGTPDQLSTSLVSCRNFKIFQYTISTQCAYLFTIKLWQNKRGDMQNIGEERGAGTVFMFLYTLSEKMNIIFMECQILLAFIHPNSPQPLQVPVLSMKLQWQRRYLYRYWGCSTPLQVGH